MSSSCRFCNIYMALDFFAGCVGGIAGVLAGHPLDTVKVKLQTQKGRNPELRGTWQAFLTIFKNESAKGLYKGVTSPLLGISFVNAVLFGTYGPILRRLNSDSLCSHAVAGCAAGLAQVVVSCPIDLVKTRLQVQKTPIYKSALDCSFKIVKAEGISGLYRGIFITTLRDIPSSGVYFASYEAIMRRGDGTTAEMLLAGGIAGLLSWFVIYPLDVVKTRLQSEGIPGEAPKYKGMVHCVRRSLAEEGTSFLFRGLNSTLIRAFPTNSVILTVANWVYKLADSFQLSDKQTVQRDKL